MGSLCADATGGAAYLNIEQSTALRTSQDAHRGRVGFAALKAFQPEIFTLGHRVIVEEVSSSSLQAAI